LFEPVRPIRVYERVVQEIEDAIQRGELAPGDRLPSERAMMEQFGVSRSTIREALRVLERDGLVRSRGGDPNGPVVLPVSTEGLRRSLLLLTRGRHVDLVELLQFRMLIEGGAARLAAACRSDDDLDLLGARLTAMEDACDLGDAQTFSRADLDFHDTVAVIAGNELLQVANEVVRAVVLQLVAVKVTSADDERTQMRENCARHAEVLDAIRDADGERAAYLSRVHIFDAYAGQLDPEDRHRVAAMLAAPGDPREVFA
jgi:GntR family transcriptional regulator, transcriptional repressor for pyruvate dehydrogenase complex